MIEKKETREAKRLLSQTLRSLKKMRDRDQIFVGGQKRASLVYEFRKDLTHVHARARSQIKLVVRLSGGNFTLVLEMSPDELAIVIRTAELHLEELERIDSEAELEWATT